MVFAFPHPRANPALNPPCLSHVKPTVPYAGTGANIPRGLRAGTRGAPAHMLLSPPHKGSLGTGASRRGVILRAAALVPPRQGFPGRERKHVMRHPPVRPVKVPLPSGSLMRNPPSLSRAGISWLVMRLHHHLQANRTLYIPLSSPLPCCGAAEQPPTGAGRRDKRKGMLRAGRQPCPEGRSKFSITQSHFPDCRNHNCPLYAQSRRGCRLGAVPAREHVGFALCYL